MPEQERIQQQNVQEEVVSDTDEPVIRERKKKKERIVDKKATEEFINKFIQKKRIVDEEAAEEFIDKPEQMFEVTEKDIDQAEKVFDIVEGRADATELRILDAFSAFDVPRDTHDFQWQMAIASALELEVPALAVKAGPPIPIKVEIPSVWSQSLDRDAEARRRYNEVKESYDVRVSVKEARSAFRTLAITFLSTRIAGVNLWAAGRWASAELRVPRSIWEKNIVPAPGCQFTVVTKNDGLRVFWSGAYYISKKYFGGPTNPARSVLQSGNYVFGIDGGAYVETVWDDAQVMLPGYNTSLRLTF